MSEPKQYQTENGVKPRYDGAGSEFGAAHRDLGPGYLMFDIDRMTATVESELELKREDTVFVEYRLREDRVTFVALFEYKRNKSQYTLQALSPDEANSRARLEIARRLQCRLFVVFADNGQVPLDFYEIDVNTSMSNHVGLLWYTKDDRPDKVKEFWNNKLHINRYL